MGLASLKINRLHLRFLWWAGFLHAFDWAARWRREKPQPGRLLIVRTDAIGDFILWLDSAKELRRLYPAPQWHITLICNRLCIPLAGDLDFDEVWELDRARFVLNPLYRYRILNRVANGRFSVAIHPVYTRDFLWGDSIIRAAAAPMKIGFGGERMLLIPTEERILDHWYTRIVRGSSNSNSELRKDAEFVRELGCPSFRVRMPRLQPRAALPSSLSGREFYLVCPAASHEIKQWPLEYFAVIAERIYSATGWTGVVVGSRAEGEIAAKLIARTKAPLENWAAKTTIPELITIISVAQMVITNDSAPVHISAAVMTPSVCIAGGAHLGKFVPYDPAAAKDGCAPVVLTHWMPCFGCQWYCTQPRRNHEAAPCISQVTVEQVWAQVEIILSSVLRSSSERVVR